MNESILNQRFLSSSELEAHEAKVDAEIRAYLATAPALPAGQDIDE